MSAIPRKKISILCVDDDSGARFTLEEILRDFQLKMAENGEKALEYLRQNKFDLAILDYELPDMTGAELAHWMRLHAPDTPVIMCTSHDKDTKVIADILDTPNFGFVHKPFQKKELLEAVGRILNFRIPIVYEVSTGFKDGSLKKELVKKKLEALEEREARLAELLDAANRVLHGSVSTGEGKVVDVLDESSSLSIVKRRDDSNGFE